MKDLIHLQTANVHQSSKDDDWHVRANITGEELYTLPNKYREDDIFTIIKFGREFELKAFNTGISFQKKMDNKIFSDKEKKLLRVIKELEEANDKLANKLNQYIGEQG